MAHQATELLYNSALSSQSDLWGQGLRRQKRWKSEWKREVIDSAATMRAQLG